VTWIDAIKWNIQVRMSNKRNNRLCEYIEQEKIHCNIWSYKLKENTSHILTNDWLLNSSILVLYEYSMFNYQRIRKQNVDLAYQIKCLHVFSARQFLHQYCLQVTCIFYCILGPGTFNSTFENQPRSINIY